MRKITILSIAHSDPSVITGSTAFGDHACGDQPADDKEEHEQVACHPGQEAGRVRGWSVHIKI
ncbi:MAG: hypothetical protein D3910_26770 [Candidatus Electrothrix sp. ATG2]|nr:hypothetical protein [Candidatus Electrothrix sp. ATG2]